MRVADEVALVSGAGGPMGRAIAERLAEEGARLVITDISGRRLAAARDTLARTAGGPERVLAVRADVSVREEADAVADAGLREFGRVDILVNVVGGWRGGPGADLAATPLTAIDEERLIATWGLNVLPGLHFVRALAPGMVARGHGKIVNISSVNFAGEPGAGDYGAAKAAVASLTRTLAMELAPHVNVNCIAPGIIRTRVVEMLGPEVVERYRQRSLLGRLGEPRDIANAVLFLASGESSYITGEIIAVSGGIWPAL